MSRLVRLILILLLLISVPGMAYVWLMPVEYFQTWMIERANPDQYSQFAAHEQGQAMTVLLRILFPLLVILTTAGFIFYHRVVALADHSWQTLKQLTSLQQPGRTYLFRVLLISWFILGLVHFAGGVSQRIEDWPWYHFRPGSDMMANISDSNRDVIRFAKQATEEDARILVLSDQKLFFLSYYLLPRKLFHPLHPESEFVIPKEFQQRQLKAYRLSELDTDYLNKIAPDYILEYYEGGDYLEKERLMEDPHWLAFMQSQYGPDYEPSFNVRLRKFQKPEPQFNAAPQKQEATP
ncbi:hypothetical protein [Gimesia algae]|uniref:Uncharacterized protein n=1 Tax=Gimesia algae TaxID=2527971 RepID=A0A517V882_9PLAN|nr:hypothetical protein [Gimesia algae]QDT89215.1 hypothetical protein Pan161_08420 [Gimesia algae]